MSLSGSEACIHVYTNKQQYTARPLQDQVAISRSTPILHIQVHDDHSRDFITPGIFPSRNPSHHYSTTSALHQPALPLSPPPRPRVHCTACQQPWNQQARRRNLLFQSPPPGRPILTPTPLVVKPYADTWRDPALSSPEVRGRYASLHHCPIAPRN